MRNVLQLTCFTFSTCGIFCQRCFALHKPVLLYATPVIFLLGSNRKLPTKLGNRLSLYGAAKYPWTAH